jgi:hypothetical protein
MRIRSLIALLVVATGACATVPSEKLVSIDTAQRGKWGAFAIVEHLSGETDEGELLAINAFQVTLLVESSVVDVKMADVKHVTVARTATYPGAWVALDLVSATSIYFDSVFAIGTGLGWLLGAGIVAAIESGNEEYRWPADSISDIRPWARYPQGLTPRIRQALAGLPPESEPTTQPDAESEPASAPAYGDGSIDWTCDASGCYPSATICAGRQQVLPEEARSTCAHATQVFCRELAPGGARACYPTMPMCRQGQGRLDFYPAESCQPPKSGASDQP